MTAVQQVFSELETLFPNYFNVYTTEGKEFINHFHKYLAVEKEQMHSEYMRGWRDGLIKQGPPPPPLDRKIYK